MSSQHHRERMPNAHPGANHAVPIAGRFAGETIAQITQAQIIAHTVRMATQPRLRGTNMRGNWRIGLPDQDSDDSGPSEEPSASDFSEESDSSARFLGFVNN
jgi:hypothetical protein